MGSLEVCGSCLKLKHLEIVDCVCLKSLKVSAPNLTYLKVSKLDGLFLENVPRLVEIYCYCLADDISLRCLYSTVSSRVSQFEILHLVLKSRKVRQQNRRWYFSPFDVYVLIAPYLWLISQEKNEPCELP